MKIKIEMEKEYNVIQDMDYTLSELAIKSNTAFYIDFDFLVQNDILMSYEKYEDVISSFRRYNLVEKHHYTLHGFEDFYMTPQGMRLFVIAKTLEEKSI